MSRVKGGTIHKSRRKKIMDLAKGFWGGRSRLYRSARHTVEKGLTYAYRDRKVKKREFRSLWIQRINAACRMESINYSRFMAGLKKLGISLDRKILADLALNQPETFRELTQKAKQAIS
ncbi:MULTISPECIES: 50S ribosomal protein L20 [Leptospirillum]|uniref:Large ribosomal subunit protein bL20 n=3 Tax=Leptospirillum ferriphilum TaxID=178606 RepID=A0A059XSU7_9BACT|nr:MULTISPECIES: 50S ribosomal protein L20 [Leptospirillum]EAY57928.1 MAG: ribosomal protein L20 [Leptospirillum rubarum]EIJ77273.1 MAG: Ribosomal protein L20 [Leptospirillum sp. Group II 'C75']AFS52364.1 ribosomal protein L20 [Leptospirillum ferriphilum ML-04]AIA29873.1 50S ribosomal protein L20 [Leptospirillum ferriphilum YSK]AKS22561.1 50S ribosomal protein L20 [Leptospirillum sp. Group II 'CF-1']